MILHWMRGKFGKILIGGLLGLIGCVFTFYGIFSPKATRGLHEAAVAGKVNGDFIPISEFQRAFHQRLELFQRFTGGKLSAEQMRAFGLKKAVFQQLVEQKVLLQQAERFGFAVADEEVRQSIQKMKDFQKDGHFDVALYRDLLERNGFSPGRFEKRIRESLLVDRWESYFHERVYCSEAEVKRDWLATEEQRTLESIEVPFPLFEAELRKQWQLAPEAELSSEQQQQLKEHVRTFAEKLRVLLGQSRQEKALAALLKAKNLKQVVSESVSRKAAYSSRFENSGSSHLKEAIRAAFLEFEHFKEPRVYPLAGRFLVARVSASRPAPSEEVWQEKKKTVMENYAQKKIRETQSAWLKAATETAQVETNPAVVADEAEAGEG